MASSSSLEGTFLNLLVTELQNQDPTSPVDPTQMVSQMVSLNQLDQLIAIHQTLDAKSAGTSGTANSAGTAQAAKTGTSSPGKNVTTPVMPQSNTAQFQSNNTGAAGSSSLMNLYGSYALPNSTTIQNQTGVR